jgi:hypothetical protein
MCNEAHCCMIDISTVQDDDIESIISRGERKTEELNRKYANIGLDDLQRFTVQGVGSAYEWQGEDYSRVSGWINGGEKCTI